MERVGPRATPQKRRVLADLLLLGRSLSHRGRADRAPRSRPKGIFVTVNRTDLVAAIAEKANLTKKQADDALGALQEVLVENLGKGEPVKVTGLLSVERVERAARTGRNPRTGEQIDIPASYGVRISAGSLLKKAVTE